MESGNQNMIDRGRVFLAQYSLVMGALAIVSLVLASLIYVFLPEIDFSGQILLGFSTIFLLLFIIGAYSEVRAGVTSRQTRYGTNTGLMLAAFIGIMAMLNVVAAQNRIRWDMTAGGQYTLARQTITVLNELKDPIKVIGFFTANPALLGSRDQAQNLLTEYRVQSNLITYEFVDMEEKPGVARQYGVTQAGTVVFAQGDRRKLVLSVSEQDFTGAILNVTGTAQPVIYFIVGHGEHDLLSEENSGYSFVRDGLIADNYLVFPINLSSMTSIPDDAALLVIAGPKRAFLPPEIAMINEHLDDNGKLLFLADPGLPEEFAPMLARWGVAIQDGSLIDGASFVQPDMTTPAIQGNQYVPSVITREIAATFFPGAIGMTVDIPEDDNDHVFVTALAISTFQSYLEKTLGTLEFDVNVDEFGPFPLALSVEASKPIGQRPDSPTVTAEGAPDLGETYTRLLVFADSDFASNEFFYSLGNSDLFLNSVNWLTEQEQLISIRPKPAAFRRLVVTQRDWNVILYTTVGFWPMMVLLGGAFAWWRRR